MKPKLTNEEIHGKKSMVDIYRHYFPGASVIDADHFIWNETCYPFDFERAHDMIYKKYQNVTPEPETPSPEPE